MSQPSKKTSPAFRFVGGILGAIGAVIAIFSWSNLNDLLALKDASLFVVMGLIGMPAMAVLFLYVAIVGRSPLPQDAGREG